MNSEHNIQLCIQCALPVVTIMALWQLLNLGTGCTMYIYIYSTQLVRGLANNANPVPTVGAAWRITKAIVDS